MLVSSRVDVAELLGGRLQSIHFEVFESSPFGLVGEDVLDALTRLPGQKGPLAMNPGGNVLERRQVYSDNYFSGVSDN
jgi:hypothetical protein